ncbi:MAG: aldo/keto reductase [Rickettsiales bacterium]|nr:aldo/keto reductase [Rickettsiales bacterium]
MENFIYGTAWKQEATKDLVSLALKAGFRAIDTANQAKHYTETLVGKALKEAFEHGIKRQDLWIQTKFTSIGGQDHRLPYDPSATLFQQVQQSCLSSLEHLHIDYIDSYIVHGPINYPSLGAEDFEVWQAIEGLKQDGLVKEIGVSNINYQQLELLLLKANIKPKFVQNRCFANQAWDKNIRALCREHDIKYQGFSLLTANPYVLIHPEIIKIAQKHKVEPEQIIFRFAQLIGIIPLTGTTDFDHMQQDLACDNFELSETELEFIETVALISN